MKNMKSISAILLSLVLLFAMAVPAFAAVSGLSSDIMPYTISKDDLIARAKMVVKSGEITYTSLYNISYMEKSNLQQAAEASRKKGGKVFFNFDTLVNDRVTSRIIVNPFLVKDSAGGLSLVVDTSTETNKTVNEKFTKIFGRKVAVMKCSQKDSFGFTVVLSGKLDLTGMDTSKLVAYSYNASTNKYKQIVNAKCFVDDQGFVYLESQAAGHIIITEARSAT